jgi:hypothetical protein
MESNGKALIDHWGWAAQKGLMNKNTAGGLKAACSTVLGALDNGMEVDIQSLDVDGALTRFKNLRHKKFKPKVLETYDGRFRRAVQSYKEYLADPAGWKPRVVERPGRHGKSNGSPSNATAQQGAERRSAIAAAAGIPQSNLMEYPFPIREGIMARLILPRDLKQTEVKRLTAFVSTLAVDFESTAD